MAMYRAKDQGRDRHEVYGTALQVRATQRLETERLVRRALAEHLLLGKYEPGTTILVDKGAEAGLEIHAADEKTPVEAV